MYGEIPFFSIDFGIISLVFLWYESMVQWQVDYSVLYGKIRAFVLDSDLLNLIYRPLADFFWIFFFLPPQ